MTDITGGFKAPVCDRSAGITTTQKELMGSIITGMLRTGKQPHRNALSAELRARIIKASAQEKREYHALIALMEA